MTPPHIKMHGSVLYQALHNALLFADVGPLRPVLAAVHVTADPTHEGKVRFESTNSHILSRCSYATFDQETAPSNLDVLIPGTHARQILRMIDRKMHRIERGGRSTGTVYEITVAPHVGADMVVLEAPDWTYSFASQEGQFPNMDGLIRDATTRKGEGVTPGKMLGLNSTLLATIGRIRSGVAPGGTLGVYGDGNGRPVRFTVADERHPLCAEVECDTDRMTVMLMPYKLQ